MRRVLLPVEALLWTLVLVDMAVLIASVAHTVSWEPEAGASLIVLMLLTSVIHQLRTGD